MIHHYMIKCISQIGVISSAWYENKTNNNFLIPNNNSLPLLDIFYLAGACYFASVTSDSLQPYGL